MTAHCDTQGGGKDPSDSTERNWLDRAFLTAILVWTAGLSATTLGLLPQTYLSPLAAIGILVGVLTLLEGW